MAQLSKEDEFLLKEYDAAQRLTYHIDELRAKLTQFFLVFTGFATAALTLLVKGEAAKTVFAIPEGAVGLLILVAAVLGTTFVALIGRLRRAQIEHFRIVNNIRTYFLQNNYDLWNIVELSVRTLPKPNRASGSYFWTLLIIVASSYLYLLTTYIHLTKVFGFPYFICAYTLCAGVFIVALYLHDKLYFALAVPPPTRSYSPENPPKQTFQSLKLSFTWCYLLKCSEGYLLIDTSYPTCFRSFLKRTANMGIDIGEIKYLLLTHHHDDHAGFAAELVKKTGCRVVVHRNAVAALKRGKSEDTGKALNRRVQITFMFYGLYYALFHKDTYPPLALSDRDILLEGDDESFLKEIGVDGVILHTPGHTHTGDSISVVLSDGSAFVGDAAMNFLWWTGIRHRPICIGDISTVYESWQKLRDHGARVIYPAHGKPFPAQELVPPGP